VGSHLPPITVINLGGTIASATQGSRGALVRLTGDDLAETVPQIRDVAEVRMRPFRRVASGELTMSDMQELATEVRQAVVDGAKGIVITQGTDTLEETSFILDLLVSGDEPIVITGAMRNASLPGFDGPANLLAAVQVAASSEARGLGAVVVFNDEIHAARFVRKRHTTSPATFGSPLCGPIGLVTEGVCRIFLRPIGRLHIEVPKNAIPAPIALVPIGFDEQEMIIRAIPSMGYQGLVLAALGGGHVPGRLAPVLERVNEQIPVVISSRTFAGVMLASTYGYPGAEMDLLARGLISAGSFGAPHARIMLSLLLTANAGRQEIREAMAHGLTQGCDITLPQIR
jgi:L-asparaginase